MADQGCGNVAIHRSELLQHVGVNSGFALSQPRQLTVSPCVEVVLVLLSLVAGILCARMEYS
jgi:hypothetical protein